MLKNKIMKTVSAVGMAALFAFGGFSSVMAATEGSTTATVGFEAGTLELVSAPTSFNFGENHTITDSTVTFERQGVDATAEVVVADNTFSNAGWNVTAKLSNFRQDNNDTLNGASIALIDGTVSASSTNSGAEPAQTPGNINLVSGNSEATLVQNAPVGTGTGRWTTSWDSNNVKLTVPGGSATPGTHEATINWNLSSGPTGA